MLKIQTCIMVKSYCVKQEKLTECVPGSERNVKAKNGKLTMKCSCAECGITDTKFVKKPGKLNQPVQGAGIANSIAETGHSLVSKKRS